MTNGYQDDMTATGEQVPMDDEPKQLTLMGGVAQGGGGDAFDPAVVDAQAPRNFLSQNALLLLVVALVAAGTIYAMGLTQGDLINQSVPSDAEARIEQAITQLTQQEAAQASPLQQQNLRRLFDETEDIVKMFTSDRTEHQVPLAYVQKNPFQMVKPVVEEPEVAAAVDDGRAAREREQMMNRLRNEAQRLRLEMISSGARGWVAMINGDFVQVGSKVGSFEVVKIEQFKVTVQSHDEQFELTLSR